MPVNFDEIRCPACNRYLLSIAEKADNHFRIKCRSCKNGWEVRGHFINPDAPNGKTLDSAEAAG